MQQQFARQAVLPVFLALTGACTPHQPIDPIRPDILIVLPNADKVKYSNDYDGAVSYELAVAYPATEVISAIRARLEPAGWKPASDDILNPGQENSHVRGWTNYVDGTRGQARVYQWNAAWDSQSGDRVEYWLKFLYAKDSGPTDDARPPLQVVGLYFTAPLVTRMRQESGSDPGAQSGGSMPSGWVATTAPPENSEAAECANWAQEEWTVALASDGLSPQIARSRDSATTSIDLEDGRLVGVDRGEFGGEVWWEPRLGRRQSIAKTNPVAFVRVAGVVYGLEGLAHLTEDTGALVKFERRANGSWQVTKTLDLGAAPYAVFPAAEGSLLVVISGALVQVTPPGQLTVLHRNPVWRFTYPTSVVRNRVGTVYVGMRSAVARLSPSGSELKEDWLVPSDCIRRRKSPSGLGCSCVQ